MSDSSSNTPLASPESSSATRIPAPKSRQKLLKAALLPGCGIALLAGFYIAGQVWLYAWNSAANWLGGEYDAGASGSVPSVPAMAQAHADVKSPVPRSRARYAHPLEGRIQQLIERNEKIRAAEILRLQNELSTVRRQWAEWEAKGPQATSSDPLKNQELKFEVDRTGFDFESRTTQVRTELEQTTSELKRSLDSEINWSKRIRERAARGEAGVTVRDGDIRIGEVGTTLQTSLADEERKNQVLHKGEAWQQGVKELAQLRARLFDFASGRAMTAGAQKKVNRGVVGVTEGASQERQEPSSPTVDSTKRFRLALRRWAELEKELSPGVEMWDVLFTQSKDSHAARSQTRVGLPEARTRFWEQYPDGADLTRATHDLASALVERDVANALQTMGGLLSPVLNPEFVREFSSSWTKDIERELDWVRIPPGAGQSFQAWLKEVRQQTVGRSGERLFQMRGVLKESHPLYLEYVKQRNTEEFLAGPYNPMKSSDPIIRLAGEILNAPYAASSPISVGDAILEAEALVETVGESAIARAVEQVLAARRDSENPDQLAEPHTLRCFPGKVGDSERYVYRLLLDTLAGASDEGYAVVLLCSHSSYGPKDWRQTQARLRIYERSAGREAVLKVARQIREAPCHDGLIADSTKPGHEWKSPYEWAVELLEHPGQSLPVQSAEVLAATDVAAIRQRKDRFAIIEGIVEHTVPDLQPGDDRVVLHFQGSDSKAFYVSCFHREVFSGANWGPWGEALQGRKVRVSGFVDVWDGRSVVMVREPSQIEVLDSKVLPRPEPVTTGSQTQPVFAK